MSHASVISAHGRNDVSPIGGNVLTVTSEYAQLLESAGFNSIESIFNYADGESLNKPGLASWRERIRITVADRGETHTLYLKRFTEPPARARREARHCGNGARSVAGVEWNWLHIFRAAGIPCAAPVALAEEFVRGRERRSAVIMSAVPGRSLEAWAADWTAADRKTIADLIVPTAEITARMHALGCVHCDLYLPHFFAEVGRSVKNAAALTIGRSTSDKQRRTAPIAHARGTEWSAGAYPTADSSAGKQSGDRRRRGLPSPHWRGSVSGGHSVGQIDSPTGEAMGHPTVHLIDLQRVFRPGCCFGRWVVKDLASLYFSAENLLPAGLLSRAGALRWLKTYLQVCKLDARGKRLAYRVIGRTQSMLRRQKVRRKTA